MSCEKNSKKATRYARQNGITTAGSAVAGQPLPLSRDAPRPVTAPVISSVSPKTPRSPAMPQAIERAIGETLAKGGQLHWPEIAARAGLPVEAAQRLAVEAGLAFIDPVQAQWYPRDEYLSGNIRDKLAQAEKFARENPLLQANVAALRQALPPDVQPHEINAPLGVGWIPEQDVQAFTKEVLGVDLRPTYVARQGRWQVSATAAAKRLSARESRRAQIMWGTPAKSVPEVLKATLNGQEITVRDRRGKPDLTATYAARDKQDRMRQAFSQWLWADPGRSRRLTRLYNDKFNAIVPPRFDGSRLGRLPGMSPAIELRPHQKDAVTRLLRSKTNTFLIHATGAGKTNIMIAATMEQKRLGLRQNPVHIVPNHRLDDHAADFRALYPDANLLLVDSKMLNAQNFAATMRAIAAAGGQYDAVIMSHSAFERIKLSPEAEQAGVRQQIADVDEALAGLRPSATKKRKLLTQERNRLVKKLEKMEGTPAPAGQPTWEDLNVDQIYLDEAHRYKNRPFATKHQQTRSISPAGSSRAQDAWLKLLHTQFRCRQCGKYAPQEAQLCPHCSTATTEQRGGNICLASATPIDNSLAELYTWQSTLQPQLLKEMGLEHFDAWSTQFAQPSSQFEVDLSGKSFREVRRFRNFSNVPELVSAFGMVADTQLDAQKLGLPLPVAQRHDTVVPLSAAQQDYLADCERRAELVRARAVPPTEDNFLRIANDMQLASLDLRLVDPTAADDPASLVNQAVRRVADTYRATTGVTLPAHTGRHDLTQVIFLDTGVPGGSARINLYDDIRRKLVRQGVPADKIAFIHDAKSAAAKAEIFDKMNRGELRILLASTPLAGEGANFQQRLHTLTHIDVPWTPARMKQREGRIVRQKNLNPTVNIVRMTSPGPSAYRWQTIERKALSGDQVLIGDRGSRTVDDVGDLHADYSSIKAATSGNPLVQQRFELQTELKRLKTLEQAHLAQRSAARQAVQQTQAALNLANAAEPPDDVQIRELTGQLAEQTELAALTERPFEHTARITDTQARLNDLEADIAAQSRPQLTTRQNRSVARRLGRLFGLGG
jgi:N12 class adenine-specific DNA methylase